MAYGSQFRFLSSKRFFFWLSARFSAQTPGFSVEISSAESPFPVSIFGTQPIFYGTTSCFLVEAPFLRLVAQKSCFLWHTARFFAAHSPFFCGTQPSLLRHTARDFLDSKLVFLLVLKPSHFGAKSTTLFGLQHVLFRHAALVLFSLKLYTCGLQSAFVHLPRLFTAFSPFITCLARFLARILLFHTNPVVSQLTVLVLWDLVSTLTAHSPDCLAQETLVSSFFGQHCVDV